MSADGITELAAAVAELGALPVPAGPEPSELEGLRAAYVTALDNAARTHPCPVLGDRYWSGCVHYDEAGRVSGVGSCHSERRADAVLAVRDAEMEKLRAEIAGLEAQRERRRARLVALQNDALSMRGSLSPAGGDRKVPFPLGETLTPAVDWLIARVADLEAQLHAASAAVDACTCPSADRVEPHQVGCLLAERPVNALTAVFAPVASLREPEGEFYPTVHHTYRPGLGRDLPETGGGV